MTALHPAVERAVAQYRRPLSNAPSAQAYRTGPRVSTPDPEAVARVVAQGEAIIRRAQEIEAEMRNQQAEA